MHWTSILTALVLASISAFLVVVQGWSVIDAFLATGGVAAVLILGSVGILMLLSKPEDRPHLASEILTTMRSDFKDLLRWLDSH
jgi:hypothetical protein